MSGSLIYYCYCLYNDSNNKTYIGSTNNLVRRLRQHNGEITGGAKYTTAQKVDWKHFFYITSSQFDHRTALSFEWHLKHPRVGLGPLAKGKRRSGTLWRIDSLVDTINHPKFAHIIEYNISIQENYKTHLESKLVQDDPRISINSISDNDATKEPVLDPRNCPASHSQTDTRSVSVFVPDFS